MHSELPRNELPRVACLTCTYGRFALMRDCLAFFLAQDYPAKRLFILNNHPVPLRCEVPGVTVFNEPVEGEKGIPRNRLLAKVPPDFNFVHTWDDDDAWLPWHLSQAIRQVQSAKCPSTVLRAVRLSNGKLENVAAWKPARSWIHYARERRSERRYELNRNNYEASLIVRADYMRRIGYATASGNEHRPLLDALRGEKALATTEVGARSSYIYTWRGDFSHASAALARDQRAGVDPATTFAARDAAWRELQTDPGDGKTPLTPSDIRPRYRDLLAHCRAGLSEFEALELSALLQRCEGTLCVSPAG